MLFQRLLHPDKDKIQMEISLKKAEGFCLDSSLQHLFLLGHFLSPLLHYFLPLFDVILSMLVLRLQSLRLSLVLFYIILGCYSDWKGQST